MSLIKLKINQFLNNPINAVHIDEDIEVALDADFCLFGRFVCDIDHVAHCCGSASQPQVDLAALRFSDSLFPQMERGPRQEKVVFIEVQNPL